MSNSDPIEQLAETAVDLAEGATEVVVAAVSNPLRTTELIITAPLKIGGGILRGLFGF